MVISSPVMYHNRGPRQMAISPSRTSSTAWCACGRGHNCILSPRASTPNAMRGDDRQLSVARCCSSRSAACPSGPASLRRSGSGGMVHLTLRSPTWIAPGAPTCDASMWSTLSASSSRRSIGPSHGYGTPSKPPAGPGSWCWLTLSCVWLGRWWLTSDCPGNVPNERASSRRRASSAGLRGSCHDCQSWLARQNPADGLRDVPKASARLARRAIRLSRRPSLAPPKSHKSTFPLALLLSATAPQARRSPPHAVKSQVYGTIPPPVTLQRPIRDPGCSAYGVARSARRDTRAGPGGEGDRGKQALDQQVSSQGIKRPESPADTLTESRCLAHSRERISGASQLPQRPI
jgi:hypothetical protein